MGLKGANVLVTGGTGFIGGHLAEALVETGANVTVPYLSIDPKSYFCQKGLNKQVRLVPLDIKDFKKIFAAICRFEINFVFHLAAVATVPTAYINPLETLGTNFMGTANLLEAARLYGGCSGIIVVSSDKAYGKIKRAVETDPVCGDHPYETSKAAADLLATTYFKTYGLPIVVTRFGNVYGEGDLNFTRIVPGVMRSIILSQTLLVRSNGKFRRDYVHVGDVTDAVLLLSKNFKKNIGETFNISSNENLSVIELVAKIGSILGKKVKYKILNQSVNEIPVQSINFSKIKKTLGWHPRRRIDSTIKDIYNWYRSYFSDNYGA